MEALGYFHQITGPNVGILPKHTGSKDFGARVIQTFLIEGESYSWDGPYNTRDFPVAVRKGQSLGRVFVTNKRLIFWPDEELKPNVGLFFKDIQGWQSQWLPMRSRGVRLVTGNRQFMFAAAKTAVKNAEIIFQQSRLQSENPAD